MKKKVLILCVSLIITLFISCTDNSEKIIRETNEISSKLIAETDNDNAVICEYSIIESTVNHNESDLIYTIKFPKIEGFSDSDKQKRLNEIIETEALKVLSYYEDSSGSVEVSIDYNVTLKTPSIISIQYHGNGSVSDAAHPNQLLYTTNISISDESKIRLSDIIMINPGFIKKFLEGEFQALWVEQNERVNLSKYTVEKLMDDFTNADSFENIGTLKQSDVFSYLTEDSLGISIPVSYAIGGHAEYEIKFQYIQDNIIESEMWEDILTVDDE